MASRIAAVRVRLLVPAFLLLLAIPPLASASTPVAASSDDCATQLLVVFGPHVPGACAASLSGALDVGCASACIVTFAHAASGASAAPSGAGVFAWIVYGDVAPCPYLVPLFAQGFPPCGSDSHYAYGCSAVVELAPVASCSGSLRVTLPTAPGGCTSFLTGATGYGRAYASAPDGPPSAAVAYDTAFAMEAWSLRRAEDGSGSLAAGAC
jgi:hypothetical protein